MSTPDHGPSSKEMSLLMTKRMDASPCGGIRVVLGVPTYGPPDPRCQKDIRVAMMMASVFGTVWVGDASPDRVGFNAARNMIAQSVVGDGDIDGIVWIDSDIRIPPNAIATMLSEAKRIDAEFMSGVYHMRGEPFGPVFYEYSEETHTFHAFKEYAENVVAPVGGCGFGFAYTSRRMIETIAKHPEFNGNKGWFPDQRDTGGFGEDLSFCYQAIRSGIQLYVHTGIQLGHLGDSEVITQEHFRRHQDSGKDAEEKPKVSIGPMWGMR